MTVKKLDELRRELLLNFVGNNFQPNEEQQEIQRQLDTITAKVVEDLHRETLEKLRRGY